MNPAIGKAAGSLSKERMVLRERTEAQDGTIDSIDACDDHRLSHASLSTDSCAS